MLRLPVIGLPLSAPAGVFEEAPHLFITGELSPEPRVVRVFWKVANPGSLPDGCGQPDSHFRGDSTSLYLPLDIWPPVCWRCVIFRR